MQPGRVQALPRRRRAAVCLVVLATALVAAAAISHVWTRLRAIEHGYKISKASKRHMKLLEVNRQLRIEVALLKNPARVARIASEELGMHHPRPDQIRRLRLRSPATAKAVADAHDPNPHLARVGR